MPEADDMALKFVRSVSPPWRTSVRRGRSPRPSSAAILTSATRAGAELKGNPMTSSESREFSQFCATVRERLSNPDLDLWLDGTGVNWTDPRVNLLEAELSGLPRSQSSTVRTSCSRMRRRNSRCCRKRLATINICGLFRAVSTRSSWAPAECPKLTTSSRKWGSGYEGIFR